MPLTPCRSSDEHSGPKGAAPGDTDALGEGDSEVLGDTGGLGDTDAPGDVGVVGDIGVPAEGEWLDAGAARA
ncbi:hypothetical protein [Streptomyces sp. GMY02]|uniref:hypothetical protein n=1 Tax=Streptomyces sp. GMY02 TaxID=1333528 RepID=UPI0020B75FDB|nr:hypothetical protein [Streptomyces sp. GMY02]